MSFSILDHYNGFVSNNFIKKDIKQTNLLNKISSVWDQFNKNNLFYMIKRKIKLYYKYLIQIIFRQLYGKILIPKKKNTLLKKIEINHSLFKSFTNKNYNIYSIKSARIFTDNNENVAIIKNNKIILTFVALFVILIS